MSGPREEFLTRSVDQQLAIHLDRAAGMMERVVDYGTHLLVKCDQSSGQRPLAAPVLLGRQMVEIADAISVLIGRGAVEPAKLLVRTQIETLLSLAYIADADADRRSLQYEVGHAHIRIEEHKRFDPDTQQGKQFRSQMDKDEVFKGLPSHNYRSDPAVKNLESMLARPEYAPIEAEWQRMKGEQKKRRKENAGAAPIYW